MTRRGRYIVWEGSDGVGKGTQIDLALAESEARGIPTLRVFEPGDTELGATLRQLLLHGEDLDPETELAMFLANRSHLARRKILPALEQGIDVHSDRNWWSCVYQVAAGTMTFDRVEAIHNELLPEWYMKPDLGFIMHLPTEERIRRKLAAAANDSVQLDRIESKGVKYFQAVDRGYDLIRQAKRFGAYGISALGSPEEVKARWMPILFENTA